MTRLAQLPCDRQRRNLHVGPPGLLIAMAVQVLMVRVAERDCELIADLAAERPVLRKAEVMRIRRLATANEASLRSHKPQVLAVPDAARLRQCRGSLINAFGPHFFAGPAGLP